MGLLHGIRFWRRKWVVLTALGFPASLAGEHVQMPANMGQILLSGWCPGRLMPHPIPSCPSAASTRGGLCWQRRMVGGGIPLLLPKDLSETQVVLWSLRPVLGCASKTIRNQVPALAGAPVWKCLPEAKGLGEGTAVDGKVTCKVVRLPGKAQTVESVKKGSVSKSKREKRGLRRSWNQLGCVYQLDLEVLVGFFSRQRLFLVWGCEQ